MLLSKSIIIVLLAIEVVQCLPQNYPEIENDAEETRCKPGWDCVPYYLCSNNTIITDGTGIIDIKFDDENPKECTEYLKSCCALSNQLDKPTDYPPPTPTGCGFRNEGGIGFKIGGDKDGESEYGEFPWMVAILKEENILGQNFNSYQCGGSLIHPQVVMTAAHCLSGTAIGILRARAGEWDTQTELELYPHQDRNVAEVVIHPFYNKDTLVNDVALLFLTEPFELADNVKTVCLPPPYTVFDHSRCFATGWGKKQFGKEGKYQVILKKIDLPIVPNAQCQQALRTTRLGKYFELNQSFLCAGGELGKDTCGGDGGSPLVCPIPGSPNRYYQTGIVAWGIGCGQLNIPGVYANVAHLRIWINDELSLKKIDPSYYTP